MSPALKQVFFIGDGLTSGGAAQQAIVPTGATRLFLGPMDGSGWFNNVGSFTVQVTGVSAVLEPSSVVMLGTGFLSVMAYVWHRKRAGAPGEVVPILCRGGSDA